MPKTTPRKSLISRDEARLKLETWADGYYRKKQKEQAAARDGWAFLATLHRGTPLERLRAYAEAGDPWKYIRDVHGYKTTPGQDQALELFEKEDRSIVCSGTNMGKSGIASHYLSYRFFAVSQLPDPDSDSDEPQGAIGMLPGPSHDTIADTIWREFLLCLETAADHGYPFKKMFKAKPRLAKADWKLGPKWFTRSISPERRLDQKTAHAVSGRHCANMFAMIEEGSAVMEAPWKALDAGLSGKGNKIMVCMNPDDGEPQGPAWERIESGRYAVLHLSCHDFPNVVERRTAVPGGAVSVEAVEMAIRGDCQDLGPSRPGHKLDEKRHHFLWALPTKGQEELGPRTGGGPGMEGCEEHVFAPNAHYIASKLGQFPTGFGDCPFDMVAWDECVAMWREVDHVDRWGIDPADEGPNAAMAAPITGPTVRDLWADVWSHGKPTLDEIQLLVESGELKPICVGRLERLADGDGFAVAQSAHRVCGDHPVICDKGSGGKGAHDNMSRIFGMKVTSADFGALPLALMEGEEAPDDRRVQLYLNMAQLVAWRLLLLPDDTAMRKAAQAQRKNYEHDTYRQAPGQEHKIKVTKLVQKRKIAKAVGPGAGLDSLEAVCIGIQSPDTGGFSLSTIG